MQKGLLEPDTSLLNDNQKGLFAIDTVEVNKNRIKSDIHDHLKYVYNLTTADVNSG